MQAHFTKTIIYLIAFCFPAVSWTQKEFTFPKSTDIGMNISDAISSFLGNTDKAIAAETFPLIVKKNFGANALRIGFGFQSLDNESNVVGTEQRFLDNYIISSRVGYERKRYIGNKFGFFYGLDLVYLHRSQSKLTSNQIDITRINKNLDKMGLGPVYGFEYYLSDKVYFGIEGTFYFLYTTAIDEESFINNPELNYRQVNNSFESSITSPSRLFALVRF